MAKIETLKHNFSNTDENVNTYAHADISKWSREATTNYLGTKI